MKSLIHALKFLLALALLALADAPNNQAYVGGPNEYQVYQQMRVAKQISDNNLAAAQMNQMNAMNWGMWGGWGGVGGFRY